MGQIAKQVWGQADGIGSKIDCSHSLRLGFASFSGLPVGL